MRVYAVTGVSPEIQAYAMAKYSRSAQSMRDSIAELSAQQAEQFLDTFYFQYGHRSIADLAHLALAIEDISILAAITVVDEPLWDGQERSTRYQDFRRSGWVMPEEVAATGATAPFAAAADAAFTTYHTLTAQLVDILRDRYPVPAGSDRSAHTRTLRARAFDIARYLLPLATKTSVGQVTSARVLERQISRLLSSSLAEVRAIGERMRAACREPGYDPTRERLRAALNGHGANPDVAALLTPTAPAPTLVKYAQAAPYAGCARDALRGAMSRLLEGIEPDITSTVQLAGPESLEDEAITTLLYRASPVGHSYRQIQAVVSGLSAGERRSLLDQSFAGRGQHDEWLREHQSGYALKFDILMDIGSFRDLHRHRRCVQIVPEFGPLLGIGDTAEVLRLGLGDAAPAAIAQGAGRALDGALRRALQAARTLPADQPAAAAYLLPLGTRVRALFKMDVAQAAYMIELRTGTGGHFSYRRVAWQMYQELARHYPDTARYIRATNPDLTVDLLSR